MAGKHVSPDGETPEIEWTTAIALGGVAILVIAMWLSMCLLHPSLRHETALPEAAERQLPLNH